MNTAIIYGLTPAQLFRSGCRIGFAEHANAPELGDCQDATGGTRLQSADENSVFQKVDIENRETEARSVSCPEAPGL